MVKLDDLPWQQHDSREVLLLYEQILQLKICAGSVNVRQPCLFCLPASYNRAMIREIMQEGWITMTKRFANLALSYAVIAMIFGVFYREFTKFSHFTEQTNLAFLHTHYFVLGMFFFLVLMLVEKSLYFSDRNTGKLLIVYQVGLNITGLGFLLRGLTQVWGTELSRGWTPLFPGSRGLATF